MLRQITLGQHPLAHQHVQCPGTPSVATTSMHEQMRALVEQVGKLKIDVIYSLGPTDFADLAGNGLRLDGVGCLFL